MDDPTATPAPEVDEPEADTPEGEPAEPGADDAQTDQPAAQGSPIAQAEYTRATQLAAAVRKELGLSKGATTAEVVAALSAARADEADDDDEDAEEEDPRLISERERRIEAELRVTSAVYGDEFTADALSLLNDARTSDDLDELMHKVAAFRDKHGAQLAPPATTATDAAADDDDDAEPEGDAIDLSEGDTPSRLRESTPVGRRESGAVAAIRGLFQEAGIASRPPRT